MALTGFTGHSAHKLYITGSTTTIIWPCGCLYYSFCTFLFLLKYVCLLTWSPAYWKQYIQVFASTYSTNTWSVDGVTQWPPSKLYGEWDLHAFEDAGSFFFLQEHCGSHYELPVFCYSLMSRIIRQQRFLKWVQLSHNYWYADFIKLACYQVIISSIVKGWVEWHKIIIEQLKCLRIHYCRYYIYRIWRCMSLLWGVETSDNMWPSSPQAYLARVIFSENLIDWPTGLNWRMTSVTECHAISTCWCVCCVRSVWGINCVSPYLIGTSFSAN